MIESRSILVVITCCLFLSCTGSQEQEASIQSEKDPGEGHRSAISSAAADPSARADETTERSTEAAPAGARLAEVAPAGSEGDSIPTAGRWRKHRGDIRRHELTPEQEEQIKKLETMGYLSGSRPPQGAGGVVTYDEAKAYQGFNFYVSGHAPEAILTDMEGAVLHTWSYDFDRIWPEKNVSETARGSQHWRRAYLYKNGDILAIHEGIGLIKLDKDSNLLWAYWGGCHHDLDVMSDGTIYVLARKGAIIARINENEPVLEDFIVLLDAEGNELRRVSILESMESSEYSKFLLHMRKKGDVLHTNTIEVLDGRLAGKLPAFKAGNVLVSILKISTIAVIDLETEEAVWADRGKWRQQHQPTVLDNGMMLIFDNKGLRTARSRVMEFDPATREYGWAYSGTMAQRLYSESCGSCQRLPNGNTLITESDNGRALEVTPDKTIVWEFMSPHRAGDQGEYVATLFEVIRLDPDFPLDWLP